MAEATGEFTIISEHAKRDVAEDKGTALRDLETYGLRDLETFGWMRRTLWIGIGLATVQQATGINTVNYYAPTILESTGLGTSAALIATIAVGVTSVVMTIVGIILLGKFNRRPLLLTGFAGVVGAQLILALSFLLPESIARSYLILGAMLLFVAFVQGFIGTLVWLLLSEIDGARGRLPRPRRGTPGAHRTRGRQRLLTAHPAPSHFVPTTEEIQP